MKSKVNGDDDNDDVRCFQEAPDDDHQGDDPAMRSCETVEEDHDDVQGMIGSLERSMGIVYGIGGEAYQIGISVKRLGLLVEFMKCVIETDILPYNFTSNAAGQVRFTTTVMAKYMALLPSFSRLIVDGLALSPDVRLFHRTYLVHRISQCLAGNGGMIDKRVEEVFNDFITVMRDEGKRIGIKTLIKDWQRNADENGKRLTIYIDGLFKRYARLMVIRLDLLYRQTACLDLAQAMQWNELIQERNLRARKAISEGDEINDFGDDLPRVDIFTVTEDWRHFKDNMRGKTSLFGHMVGYVTSIEFSAVGGHHLHVALIFDGSQVKQHEWLGDQIGEYFAELTGGRCYFRNCNRGTYKFPGTGLIDHHDEEKRSNLMRTLMYLAKKDQFVRVKASPKSKTFLTGHLPKPPAGRTGRPRTKGQQAMPDYVRPDREQPCVEVE